MFKLNKATVADRNILLKILDETDLYYPSIPMEHFYAVEDKGEIVGIVQFKEYEEYFFISSLGVPKAYVGKGVASFIVKSLIENAKIRSGKDIYLYTTIPDFFKRFDFIILPSIPSSPSLPSKSLYQCEECRKELCVCMVHKNR